MKFRFQHIFVLAFMFILFIQVSFPAMAENNEITLNVEDYGANGADKIADNAGIQRALDQAVNHPYTTVEIPDGTYYLEKALRISSNTHLKLSENSILIRAANFSPMLINKTTGEEGYKASSNIIVDGGTWEGNTAQFTDSIPFDHIMFGHAENITIQNTRLLNNYDGHHIELAGVLNGKVLNNYIEGYKGSRKKEAIQLDVTSSALNFPPFGSYDNTPCNNILVKGNTVVNHSRGVGSHTSVANVFHKNIEISNNTFKNLQHEAVNTLDYNQLLIKENQFENVGQGIEIVTTAGKPTDPYEIEISDNTIKQTDEKTINETSANLITTGVGIIIKGEKTNPIENVKISGNQLTSIDSHGIFLSYTNKSSILNNRITDSKQNAVALQFSSSHNLVQNNTIKNSKNHGISIYEAINNTILKNKISHSGVNGISLSTSSTGNDLESNLIEKSNKHGILIFSKSNAKVKKNTISDSKENGISINGSSKSNTLEGNTIKASGKFGIGLFENSDGNTITSNKVYDSGQYGIILNDVKKNTLKGNEIKGSSKSKNKTFDQLLVHNGATANIIEKNILRSTSYKNKARYGIHLTSSSLENKVANNKITKSGVIKDFVNAGKRNKALGNK